MLKKKKKTHTQKREKTVTESWKRFSQGGKTRNKIASGGWGERWTRHGSLTKPAMFYIFQDKVSEENKVVTCMGFPGDTSSKEPACQYRRHKRQGSSAWVRKIFWTRKQQPAPVFLPGKSQGQKSPVGYSP